jgi:hypothetical protein
MEESKQTSGLREADPVHADGLGVDVAEAFQRVAKGSLTSSSNLAVGVAEVRISALAADRELNLMAVLSYVNSGTDVGHYNAPSFAWVN